MNERRYGQWAGDEKGVPVGDCPKCCQGNTVKARAGEFIGGTCRWKH